MTKTNILTLLAVFFLSFSLLAQKAPEPINIGEKIVLKSEILKQERDIFIAMPDNYKDTDTSFPVHYVLDGEIIFKSYSAIAEIKSGDHIPAAIIVGIPNINRGHDLNPKANGVNFLNFITTELIPYIDKNYRTNKKRVFTGYSMAGNYVIYALLHKPEYFDMYISGSPFRLDMYNADKIKASLESIKTKKVLYTSMGDKDRADQLEHFKVFCNDLAKLNKGLVDFKHEIAPNRNHDTNFLINWQDGLDYIYKNRKSTEKK